MDARQLQSFCLALPGTEEDLKWENNLCFCVGKKMYAIYGPDSGSLSIKADPEMFDYLTSQEGVEPAPYLARYKWVALENLTVLDETTLQNLIRESYQMVFAKLPKKVRVGIAP